MCAAWSEESKASRPYDLVTQKILISHDVRCDEGQGWEWSESSNQKTIPVDLEITEGKASIEMGSGNDT